MQYLLTALILIPTVGAIAAVGHNFAGYKRDSHFRWIALAFSLVRLLCRFSFYREPARLAGVFVQDIPWISAIHAHYHVAVDGISLWLVLLTTLLFNFDSFKLERGRENGRWHSMPFFCCLNRQ